MRLLTPSELSAEFGFPISTTAKLRMKGNGPPFIKRGRSVLYVKEDVEAWLRTHVVRSNAEAHERERLRHG